MQTPSPRAFWWTSWGRSLDTGRCSLPDRIRAVTNREDPSYSGGPTGLHRLQWSRLAINVRRCRSTAGAVNAFHQDRLT